MQDETHTIQIHLGDGFIADAHVMRSEIARVLAKHAPPVPRWRRVLCRIGRWFRAVVALGR